MSIFQVLAFCFGLFMMYLIVVHQKKHVLSVREGIAWLLLWATFLLLSLFPDMLDGAVDLLHFSRVFDLLLVMALMVLTIVVYLSYIKQRRSEQRVEELVRSVAIRDASKKQKRSL